MVDTINATFGVAPQAFRRIDVGGPADVLLGSVLDGLMSVAELTERPVGAEFVRIDDGAWGRGDVLLDDRKQGLGLHIGRDLGEGFAAPFHHAKDDGLTSGPTSRLPRPFATDVGFVSLYSAEEGCVTVTHETANLAKHAECGAVINSQLPLQLHRGNASPGLGHQEDGVEPISKGSFGLVEDGMGGWGNQSPAEFTTIGFLGADTKVLRDLSTLLAGDAVGPTGVEDKIQAGVIGWELSVKHGLGVLTHRGILLSNLDTSIAHQLRYVNALSPLKNYAPLLEAAKFTLSVMLANHDDVELSEQMAIEKLRAAIAAVEGRIV